jgi:chemotaxis protein histidine kinase CheA
MTAPTPSFLDFFVLEAGEYVEQLDGLLLKAGTSAPDPEALQKTARALRGSATMARIPMFAELASTLEALGRALKQGSLQFSPALKGAMTGAIDDLKILVRSARTWSEKEDQLAMKRIGELSQFAGIQPSYAQSATAASGSYFGAEAAALANQLEALAAKPTDRTEALHVLQRVRALRGVAGVRDVPALAEASEAAESAVRPLELSDTPLPADNVLVLRAAGDLLRAIATSMAAGQTVTTATAEYHSFLSALDGMLANESGADRVIPIAELFYDDKGASIVSQAPNPPTTPAQRFRMEVVSLGEHLHRVIDEARSATDDIQREHARGGLGRALRAIRATAASFSQMAVAQTVEGYLERTGDLNVAALDAISSFAATISPAATAPTPSVATSAVGLRMTHVRGAVAALGVPKPPAPPVAPPAPPAPAAAPAAAPAPAAPLPAARPQMRPTTATPAAAVAAMMAQAAATSQSSSLDASIDAFDSLSMERMAEPAVLGDDPIPVDALFYRGRAALDRAIELRDTARKAGGQPTAEVLEEIYDLLDLARVESPAF